MVKKISIKFASSLGKELNTNFEEIDVFRYGFELILGGLLKVFIIAIISYFLGSFKTTMLCIGSYISIRHFGGGVHLSTYYRCLSSGTIIFLLLGKITLINIKPEILNSIIVFVLFIGTYVIFKWVPSRIGYREIKCKTQRRKNKHQTLFIFYLLLILNIFFLRVNLIGYALVSISGVSLSLLCITPFGYKFFNTLEYILNKIQGEI